MSQRQLHGARNRARPRRYTVRNGRRREEGLVSARPCGMEARDTVLDRAKANLRKAAEAWVSVRPNAKPYSQSRPGSTGGGVVRNSAHLTRGDLMASVADAAVGGTDFETTHRCASREVGSSHIRLRSRVTPVEPRRRRSHELETSTAAL